MIKLQDGTILRNLEEQVQYLTSYHNVNQGLAQWGIKVVGRVDSVAELPPANTYSGDFGDAYAVGTEAPYFFYIWTRSTILGEDNYWFPFGEISIAGPAGPVGPVGPKGETGYSTKWYAGNADPFVVSGYETGDMYLNTISGQVFRFQESKWVSITNILGPQGPQGNTGPQGPQGEIGPEGPQGPQGDVGGFINIWGIIDNIGQLEDPAELNNLSVAYLVGTASPYSLYIQVGDDPATAEWKDVGPLNTSTLVLFEGRYLNIWDADQTLAQYIKKIDVSYNPTNGGLYSLVGGSVNTNTGNTSVLFGQGNNNSVSGAIIGGNGNTNRGATSIQTGSNNENYAANSFVGGQGCINKALNSIVFGQENKNGDISDTNININYGLNSVVFGRNNINQNNASGSRTAQYSVIVGNDNKNNGQNVLMAGRGLFNNYNYKTIIGKYNANGNNMFEIGNGSDSAHPRTIFSVDTAGVATSDALRTQITNAKHLTTVEYVEFELDTLRDDIDYVYSRQLYQHNVLIQADGTNNAYCVLSFVSKYSGAIETWDELFRQLPTGHNQLTGYIYKTPMHSTYNSAISMNKGSELTVMYRYGELNTIETITQSELEENYYITDSYTAL